MANDDDAAGLYTGDGTVDVWGRPAKKSKTGRWRASCFVMANQLLVSITYYGVYNNLTRYLTEVFHEGNAAAANHVNAWTGTSSVTALFGAWISDSYLGRYWTSTLFLVIYLVSTVLLFLSPAISSLKPPSCQDDVDCKAATRGQAAFLYLALYLGALAAGGYQPCNSSLGADQFDEEDPVEMSQKTVYFNWFYLSMTVGSLIASTVVLFIQENVSWSWGFGVAIISMALSLVVFLAGSRYYRNHKPAGNPLVRMLQVVVASFRKLTWNADNRLLYEVEYDEAFPCRKIPHTKKLRFFDRAAMLDEEDAVKNDRWKVCTVTQVEEFKVLVRMLPIFFCSIIYSIVYSQMATLFLEQGATMDTHIGKYKIPPGSLSVFESFSIIFWTPVYSRLLVPQIRKLTKHPKGLTDLQRIGTGIVIVMLAMVAAALVEVRRLSVVRHHGLLDDTVTTVPMSVFWLVPQYFLIGASEVFTFIGLTEFFYAQSPDSIRALGSSLQLTALALGNYSSSLVVTLVTKVTGSGGRTSWIPDNLNRGHVDYYYWMLAIVSVANLGLFVPLARRYNYIEFESKSSNPEKKNEASA